MITITKRSGIGGTTISEYKVDSIICESSIDNNIQCPLKIKNVSPSLKFVTSFMYHPNDVKSLFTRVEVIYDYSDEKGHSFFLTLVGRLNRFRSTKSHFVIYKMF